MKNRYFNNIYTSILRPYVQNRGKQQFKFLKQNGLLEHHTLLDLGCGRLWGGQFFIPYLRNDCYYGIDIVPAVIRACNILIQDHEEFGIKNPQISMDINSVLDQNIIFDFGIASSIFNHNTIDVFSYYIRQLYKKVNNMFFDVNLADIDCSYIASSLITAFSCDTLHNSVKDICILHKINDNWINNKQIDISKFNSAKWVKRQIFQIEWV